jgi:hypothetical protein
MTIKYPHGYGHTLLDIDTLFIRNHLDKMHPEYARRLRAWLIAQDGEIGIGGSWRSTGSQPDKPGFAPEGKSFHQYQRFASGAVKFCAVDLVARNDDGLLKRLFTLNGSKANPDASTLKRLLTVSKVHRAPRWDEVPAQGSAAALRWRAHCNIATESWHMQPVIDHIAGYDGLDGWQSWINAGSPDPVAVTAAPPAPTPKPPTPPPQEDEMILIQPKDPRFNGGVFTVDGHPVSTETLAELKKLHGARLVIVKQDHKWWDEATLERLGSLTRSLYAG